MIKCNKCGEIKEPKEFSKDKSNKKTGRQRHCKACGSLVWKARVKADPEQERWRHILRKYNLTKKQWEELFSKLLCYLPNKRPWFYVWLAHGPRPYYW